MLDLRVVVMLIQYLLEHVQDIIYAVLQIYLSLVMMEMLLSVELWEEQLELPASTSMEYSRSVEIQLGAPVRLVTV